MDVGENFHICTSILKCATHSSHIIHQKLYIYNINYAATSAPRFVLDKILVVFYADLLEKKEGNEMASIQ